MNKHSFTDEQLLNLVNNTIKTKTDFDISEFTGGSVQITSTNNNQLAKYKVSLFFGYKHKNPISRTIDINDGLVNIWLSAINLKVKSMQVLNNGMDYSELNSLMNNSSLEVDSNIVDSNIVVSRGITTGSKVGSKNGDEKLDLAKRTIDFLNQTVGKSFNYTDGNLKEIKSQINKLLKTGDTLEVIENKFAHVIRVKSQEWLNNQEMKKHLNPVTLFRESKFDKYLNQDMGFSTSDLVDRIYEARGK